MKWFIILIKKKYSNKEYDDHVSSRMVKSSVTKKWSKWVSTIRV